ncbi:MAG: WS/DGAT domain-containing protein [Steroidobacteraceae bacterium]
MTDLLARRTTLPDVQISNVAGAPHAMYLCGARIEKLWPFGPVPGTAAMFTMHSLSGGCHVGVNLDPAAIVDPQGLANGLQHGFEEVLTLAGGRVPRLARPWIGAEQAR